MPVPTLESYRKQAKQFVRWHRDREWTVAQIIREFAPRFAGMSDREILDAAFKLADAQEIVARKAGFASWAELKVAASAETAEASAAPGDDESAPPQAPARMAEPLRPFLRIAVAHVFVTDMARAIAFYRDQLGFTVEFTYGEPAYFGAVVRDGARFFLRHVDEPLIDEATRRREHLLSLAIVVEHREQLKRWFAELQMAAVPIHQTLKKHPWGDWDFVVRDPDGNLISFVCSAEPR